MNQSVHQVAASEAYREIRHKRMLAYGFVVSVIGLPVGIVLGQPVVWGLAILGIVIGGIKFLLRRHK
jgi:hypothetical protein